MTSVSAGHIILTPTLPVGSGRESSLGPPHQESCALRTELPRPPRETHTTKTLKSDREMHVHKYLKIERGGVKKKDVCRGKSQKRERDRQRYI